MNQALKDQRIQELISLYNNGAIKECLLRAKKVAKIYPEEPFVFNLIGVVNASIGSHEEAIESYKRALKINPDYFEVSSMHLKIKVPLDKWVYLTENFLNIHKRHINIDDKQMELDLC